MLLENVAALPGARTVTDVVDNAYPTPDARTLTLSIDPPLIIARSLAPLAVPTPTTVKSGGPS